MNTQEVLDELVQELYNMKKPRKLRTHLVINGEISPVANGDYVETRITEEYSDGIDDAINLILTKKQQVQNLEDYNNKSLNLIKSYFTPKNTIE
jgi:hypothetical protein